MPPATARYTGVDFSLPVPVAGPGNLAPAKLSGAAYHPSLARLQRNGDLRRVMKVSRDESHPVDVLKLFPLSDYEDADEKTLLEQLLSTTVRDLKEGRSTTSQDTIALLHKLFGTQNLDAKLDEAADRVKDPAEAALARAARKRLVDLDDRVLKLLGTPGAAPELSEFAKVARAIDAVDGALTEAEKVPKDVEPEEDAVAATPAKTAPESDEAFYTPPSVAQKPLSVDTPIPEHKEDIEKRLEEVQEIFTKASINGYTIGFTNNERFQYKDNHGRVISFPDYLSQSGITEKQTTALHRLREYRQRVRDALKAINKAEKQARKEALKTPTKSPAPAPRRSNRNVNN